MAFRDFRFPDVQHDLGLTMAEADLFGSVPPLELASHFAEAMPANIDLALSVGTEKARSAFIVAPILAELRRLFGHSFGLFPGVEFNVDEARGLNGYCDFIVTRSPMQFVVTAPILAIAEAKNDNLRNGYGQCISAMVAARDFNDRAGTPVPAVHGVVTTGGAWKFLRLIGDDLTFDRHEYGITELGRILGILAHLIRAT